VEFRELSEEEWAFIEPLLPPRAKTGRPRVDDGVVLNGILHVLTTGCRWRPISELPIGIYNTLGTCLIMRLRLFKLLGGILD